MEHRRKLIQFTFVLCIPLFSGCDLSNASIEANHVAEKKEGIAENKNGNSIEERFEPPMGFHRISLGEHSFGTFLRHFPLKPLGTGVHLFNGQLKSNQVHEAVFDLSVGNKDLQQCADAIMRMRAEYLYAENRKNEIHFHLTNGFDMAYSQWMKGNRLQVNGNKTTWIHAQESMDTHESFLQYMEVVFNYAGTLSLSKELQTKSAKDIQPGDVWIFGGSPGHAVLVVDVAENDQGEKVFMIAQSYMPAQDMHILKNFGETEISPWYHLPSGQLHTPEWDFEQDELKTWH
jgi:hypothetical protein